MLRYHMHNSTRLVEFSATCAGLMQAKAFRRSHAEFKRRRIREVLQLIPTAVPCGVVVDRT